MFIRKLHSTDKTQWLVLWQEYLHFYQTSLPEHLPSILGKNCFLIKK